MAQANRPHKPPTTPRDAIEGSRNRTSAHRVKTSRPSMRSMPTRKTTSTSIPEGELHKQGPPRRNTLGRLGTGLNADARRMLLLRHLHRRPLALRVDIPDEEEERSTLGLPKPQEQSRKRNRSEHSMPTIGQRKGVLLRRVHLLPPT